MNTQVPDLKGVNVRLYPAHQVANKPQINGKEVSHAEYLEHMNGRLRLYVPTVRGEHKVQMRGTVPAEWSLV